MRMEKEKEQSIAAQKSNGDWVFRSGREGNAVGCHVYYVSENLQIT